MRLVSSSELLTATEYLNYYKVHLTKEHLITKIIMM